jgi:hypothetical protein
VKTVKRVVENITVVAVVDKDTETMGIGFSVCDEDDKFNPKIGVDIATGRACKAIANKKGEYFKRLDVVVDFSKAGFNTRGIKGAPKSIFQQGPITSKEYSAGNIKLSDVRKFEVLFNKKPVLKALGLPL